MRQQDLVAWGGRRLDWILTTEERVVTTIALLVGLAIVDVARDGGLTNVIHNAENLAAIAAGLYGLALVLRRMRGVTVAKQKRPPAGEKDR